MNHREITLQELQNVVKEKTYSKVLEIGAGGHSFEECFNYDEYISSDKHGNGDIDLNIDAHNIPFDNNTFDCVFMCHTFEHFENPIKALREIYRVLKVGGTIINVTPNHGEHQIKHGDHDHIFVLTELQSEKLLGYVGFKNINVYTQTETNGNKIKKEQNYNLFSIAEK